MIVAGCRSLMLQMFALTDSSGRHSTPSFVMDELLTSEICKWMIIRRFCLVSPDSRLLISKR